MSDHDSLVSARWINRALVTIEPIIDVIENLVFMPIDRDELFFPGRLRPTARSL